VEVGGVLVPELQKLISKARNRRKCLPVVGNNKMKKAGGISFNL
jgi:hypothetical protein